MGDKQSAAFFDVDGTLTKERVWRGMLEYFKMNGMKRGTHYAYLLLHYPTYILYKARLISEVTFRKPWAANMAWYLRGYQPKECDPIWDWIVTVFMHGNWRDDVLSILHANLNQNNPVVLVSSGPIPIIARIAKHFGCEHAVGTNLEIKDGRYTGRSLRPICIDTYKASMAKEYLARIGIQIDYQNSTAYADSTTDLSMLEMVGHPTAVYPNSGLREIATRRDWRLFPE